MDRAAGPSRATSTISANEGGSERPSVSRLADAERGLHGTGPIGTVDQELAVKILGLYPAWWRARYEEEMRALLDQHQVTLRTRINLLRGALDAWLFIRRTGMTPQRHHSWFHPAWVLAIPSLFVVAHFLVQILYYGDDSSLSGQVAATGVVAWTALCVATGFQLRHVATTKDAVVAGLRTGLLAWALAWVLGESLFLLGMAGLYQWASPGLISPAPDPATALRWLVMPYALTRLLLTALASGLLGSGLALVGCKFGKWVGQFEIVMRRRDRPSTSGS
jgi:hypothetical protein